MKITEFCIERPVFATVINLLIILAGVIAFRSLTVREFPNIVTPVVNVETFYPGASAEIIETEITRPLEDAISGIEGIDFISSVSRDEQSSISITFKPNRNLDGATNDIRDSVGRMKGILPNDAKDPIVAKVEADANAIIWLAFSSERFTLMEMSEFAGRYVKDKLEILPGIANIIIAGERRPTMRVWIDPIRLAAYSLTVQDVVKALGSQNIALPSGRLESNSVEYTVYTQTDLQTETEFKNIILSDNGGYLLRLGDVANVIVAPQSERFLARYNGKDALGLGIVKQSTANPLDVAKALRKILPSIEASLPAGMDLALAYDSTIVIKESIKSVYQTIIEATVLVVLIIFFFLRTMRATLIPIVTIPISLVGGFGLMLLFGFSINILTLLAMVLAIGLVVDDAIVVLENIHRHIEAGMSPLEAAKKGSKEIGSAIIAMTLTLVSVFAPIAFTEGKVGKLFAEFAVVLAGTVVISGFTALTLSPMMCAKFFKPHQDTHRPKWDLKIESWLQKLTQRYRKILGWCLVNRRRVIFGLICVLALNIVLFSRLNSEMMPSEDRGFIMTIGIAPEGSTIDYTTHYAMKNEPLLTQKPIESYFHIIGWPNVQQAVAFALLEPWEKRSVSQQSVVERLGGPLYGNPGLLAFAINPSSSIEQDFMAPAVGLVIQTAGSYDELQKITSAIVDKARQNPRLLNLDTNLKLNKPQIDLHVDREKAAQSGIDIDRLGETLQILFGGKEITQFKRGTKKYDVIVQAENNFRERPSDLSAVLVRAKDGTMLPLSTILENKLTTTASALNHFNKLPAVTITASLAPGYSLSDALGYLEGVAKEVGQEKVQIDYSGPSRTFTQSSGSLYLTFILALVVVFLVLCAQFESFMNPLIIMFSVPLGIAGALLTLNIVGGSLNIYSQIGLITLVGLITKHGILLVEFTNTLKREGYSVYEALLEAATLRLRPILMTTAATALGAIPLALASGAGAEGRHSIGWCIVGGMVIGTALTLFVVPVIYSVFTISDKPGVQASRRQIIPRKLQTVFPQKEEMLE